MAGMSAKVAGTGKITSEIRRIARAYPKGFAAALYKLGVAILSEALPMTPVEFAVLRSSAYVSPPTGSGAQTDVAVGYGTVYAVPQHEHLDWNHPRGGGPKYLQRAVDRLAPRALALLAKWSVEGKAYASAGVPSRPTHGNTNRSKSQKARLTRAASNVRKRTGR